MKFGHQLGNKIRSHIRLGQLEGVEVLDAEGRIKSEDLFHDAGQLGVLHDRLVVSLDSTDRNNFPRQTLPGRVWQVWFGDLHLEPSCLRVPDDGQDLLDRRVPNQVAQDAHGVVKVHAQLEGVEVRTPRPVFNGMATNKV